MPDPTTASEPITVVVATRDRPDLAAGCLQALAAACRPGDRVLVVDSASAAPAARRLAAAAAEAGADLLRCEEPGASRARNAGWRAAATPLVAFTDDDCRPEPGWAAALAAALAGEGAADFVTGRVVPEGDVGGRARLTLSVHGDPEPRELGPGTDPSRLGHGANMAWRRPALEGLDGFDEAFGPGAPLRAAEDHDLFWRALTGGAKGRYLPEAVVRHHQWRSRRAQLATYHGYGVGSGALAVKQAAGLDRKVVAGLLWHRGLVPAARDLAAGYQMGAAGQLAELVGALRGASLARRWPVDAAGHFNPPG